ncbi:hypothetical protein JZ751_029180 [Albula glossodonta]|uniref:Ig-like domain-containing protein n=1 Tax=Albula glossodonta TaxID=121402 RepID=A0A8T2P5T2_9TELE|nr:hypothetical protein JZ751_029180 [Albula glossodonta]
MQQGPLVRVVGTHVTLSCRVSGYHGAQHQNFRWSFYRPGAPTIALCILSTDDPHSTYAVFQQRVSSGGIFMERTGPDSARLHITRLQPQDQGVYECHTPSTDPIYRGKYSNTVNLTVIPNTLQVSLSSQLEPKGARQGKMAHLACQVLTMTVHHTHVSVSWHLERQDGDMLEIASLSRDFLLQPQPAFQDRLLVVKSSLSVYRLTLLPLRLSDLGEVYCRATEWIQDPNQTWYPLSVQQSNRVTLRMTAVSAQAPDTGSDLKVTPACSHTRPLTESCSQSSLLLLASLPMLRLQVC